MVTLQYPNVQIWTQKVGTGATVATLADASELPGTVTVAQVNYSTVTDGEVMSTHFFTWIFHAFASCACSVLSLHTYCTFRSYLSLHTCYFNFVSKVEQNWATLQGGEMTIQTTQASEATQAVASLAEAAVAASQEMQQGATVTMALNRYSWEVEVKLGSGIERKEILNRSSI